MSDEELVLVCLDGDGEAFHTLMERYKGKAMALALSVLHNREDAEDVCQDAFVKAYLNLSRFDPARNFRTWFFTVLCNLCRDRLRMRGRFFKFARRYQSEFVAPRKREDSVSVPKKCLDGRLLRGLSPKERIAVWLWAHEDCSGEEIASVLRCAPATARVHLYKARRKIKSLLEKANVAM
jgi:RNA polymerase sigma-70 factor (ECF subfamily)